MKVHKGEFPLAKVGRRDLIIMSLKKTETSSPKLGLLPPQRFENTKWVLTLETPLEGGRFQMVPIPYYLFNILLTEEQYEEYKTLPVETVFSVKLSVVK
ncbi:MAG: hypothetical protein AAB587_01060 [Patescibacteria group bacterium]